MASTINGTSTGNGGLISTGDDSGILNIQTNETTAITVDASQNVGIGTTSPVVKLNVVGSNNANNAGVAGGSYGIRFENGVTYSLTGSAISGVDNTFTTSFQPLTVNGSQLGFAISGTERMRIDSSGNVGIGTTSPATLLHLSSATPPNIRLQSDTTSSAMGIDFYYTSAAGSKGGLIANFGAGEVRLSAGASGNTYFQSFYTNAAERMRIDSSGNLLVGCTSRYSTIVQGLQLQASGSASLALSRTSDNGTVARFFSTSTDVGNISVTGSTTTFNSTSDYRLKENVQPMTGALAKVAQLKPVTYKWKVDGSNGQGFIAHELAEVVPDCVTGKKDALDKDGNPDYQGIDTSFLVATLTAAIQELKAINDTQAETINALTARIVALETA
jgi:hypothetical protein